MGQIRGIESMKNTPELLKKCRNVPTFSTDLTDRRLAKDDVKEIKSRNAWGKDDYKALIHKNMEGYKENE